ncbi:transcription factor-like 5 isoform X1 [Paramuricea clavata]|uniref:Transcription factor-like 5 isoform X1 n=1 Tax=Paramuricea clavata TaxID=317549 RepID=A0A6S7IMJ5_PARCT|nr:transcription factor-like 5 isoform X1 [Paramuricea clavata]
MKERLPASQQSCEPGEKKTCQETKSLEGNETTTYSELLTPDHDCPLSSMLNLPLSKGGANTPALPSSTTTVPPPGEQFIPEHYPYPQEEMKKSNEAMVLPDAFNFQNQELVIPNTCNSHADPNTLYFPSNRTFEKKEVPSFHEVQVKSDIARKASEVLKNEKQYATRMTTVSFPVKFGENSRKRQRTNDGVKSALQRKMEHLDKEKERRLRQTKCYDYLRSLVPCGNLKTDKANILEVTVAYLTYIKETLGTSMDVIDKNFLDDFERNKESSD